MDLVRALPRASDSVRHPRLPLLGFVVGSAVSVLLWLGLGAMLYWLVAAH